MRTLKPIYDHDVYSKGIEKLIYAQLYVSIFAPLYEILKDPNQVRNSSPRSLIDALRTGRLQYVSGFFIGKLNVAISKDLKGIGARYNKTRRAYAIERANLPSEVLLAVSDANLIAKEKLKKVEDFLSAIEGRKLTKMQLEPFFGETIDKLDKQFGSTTKVITGSDIAIPLNERYKEALKVAYTDNLDLYIQDWHDEQILHLRKKVAKNVTEGFRAEKMVEDIQQQQGVSYRKAKFLARQETSLMVSKYRQIRYQDIGLNKYQWSTSHDGRVRHDHRELQGKIFSYDNPPVTDRHTMARNNPGEDYNCRCVAIPVLTTKEILKKDYAHAS